MQCHTSLIEALAVPVALAGGSFNIAGFAEDVVDIDIEETSAAEGEEGTSKDDDWAV